MKQLMDASRRKAHVARLVRVGAIWASLATVGCRSIHEAARDGDVAVVCYLLEHGADVSLFGHDKPLHMAVRGGHVNIARILLEHKADVNAKGMDGATALDVASASGLADMAAFQLKSGAVRTQRGEHAE